MTAFSEFLPYPRQVKNLPHQEIELYCVETEAELGLKPEAIICRQSASHLKKAWWLFLCPDKSQIERLVSHLARVS